ncbi:succinate dehydrogenase/fumarate reductase flavoprotein subunit [Natranaerovirga hydrolytica]|uniref:Succinate dehydrogenase/fumarate reductase flavoprotein subunit n=1 Tax=Natranaerovirga hydrolytica TaxID=680378 RepID=A0A4R1N6I4_9FIRM|nr:FAD-binding protein [Natranaerovirga hydrolytica]TCK98639.1 succinate dehydrogenase/fumarate reductase flavoprotein subunit [Natranaerovirga hydrolytica]
MKDISGHIQIKDMKLNVYEYNTIIIGSGAASLNAADTLYKLGQRDIALITEGMNRGTSRNTGSDKQTYYKQSTTIKDEDSPLKMAQTLYNGGGMHGDIALVEAALSLKGFYNLINIGVPFPHDEYGQYVGYKTDHDENSRASSVGPLTSKYMTEKLEEQVKKNQTDIFDQFLVIGILKDEENEEAIGILAVDKKNIDHNYGLTVFNCTNIIFGTGGPASTYYRSVYPKRQSGSTGIALEAGVKGHNFTEWQYGIASIKFRWNLSGTYQQVIPRYISTDEAMEDEKEFLEDYFDNPTDLLNAVFLKGYQWPFDPRKLLNNGSSIIDLLIYIETQIKGRRVFMDFRKNPSCADKDGVFNFSLLGKEAYEYLSNSNALLDLPINRLIKMNPLAIQLYKDHQIDLETEPLEIDVCAQHQNGGLVGNTWWESNVKHFFPVGEVNGTLGVYRPGGTALNSTQVGSYRAAEYIANIYTQKPLMINEFEEKVSNQLHQKLDFIQGIQLDESNTFDLIQFQESLQMKMSKYGAFIREISSIDKTIKELNETFNHLNELIQIKTIKELPTVFNIYDMIITQITLLNAIKAYIDQGGDSRGSYLVHHKEGQYILDYEGLKVQYALENTMEDKICEVQVKKGGKGLEVYQNWNQVRPIPNYDSWFENVWHSYRENKIYS